MTAVTLPGSGRGVRGPVTSCASCLAFGLTHGRRLCLACRSFAARHKQSGQCGACGREQPLKAGYCSLCWQQARLERVTGAGTPLAACLPDVRHHQLFFAGMTRRRQQPRLPPRRRGAKGRPARPPPPAALRPRGGWFQPALFEAIPRDYGYGRYDLRRQPAPANPWLAWALHLAHTLAEARGWDATVRRALNRTLVMLLSGHAEGEMIRVSQFRAVVRERGASVQHATEILTTMGILADDLPATFEKWLTGKLGGVAPGMRSGTERWARALHDGSPRARARDPHTVRAYLNAIRPALLEWSATRGHLREVTREDVLAHLGTLQGPQRQNALVALRSLFAWATKNGVVFRDHASRIKAGQAACAVFQPLPPEQITLTIEAATTPQARLAVALAAVHAARPQAIRALQLADIELGNRRLTIAGRTRPLDDLTYEVLLAWLSHRRQRWPDTANPHVLVNIKTALGTRPVSHTWLQPVLRGLPATLERLRIDRQLEEAITRGPDPLHLAVVFGVDGKTAVRYAAAARQILERPHETTTAASPRTHGSVAGNNRNRPSGSG